MVVGHRGSPAVLPENTLPSCAYALKEGANGLEIDLSITCDGQIVLWHDWSPNGEVARLRWLEFEPETKFRPVHPAEDRYLKPVCELDLETFRRVYGYCEKKSDERYDVVIPTFEEFMEWAGGEPNLRTLFLDIKVPAERSDVMRTFIRELKRIIEPYRDTIEFVLETTEKGVLDHLVRGELGCRISLDTEVMGGLILFPERFSSVDKAILYNLSAALVLRPRMITFAPWTTYRRLMRHEVELQQRGVNDVKEGKVDHVIAATINNEKEMEWLIRLGVSGIQTDMPGKLRRVVDRLGIPA